MRTLRYKYDKEYINMEKIEQNENLQKITLEEFAKLVKDMRHQQRRYFATRNKDVLTESRKLEAKVDAVINDMFDLQRKLF